MIRYSRKTLFSNFVARHYILLSMVMLILILGTGYWFWLRPYSNEVFVFQKQSMLNRVRRIEEQKNYLENLQDVETYYTSISNDVLASIERAVPSDTQMAALYTEIEAIVLDNGLQLTSVDFSERPNQTEQVYKEVSVAINVTGGGYEEFKSFLGQLEKNLRIYDITSIKYSPKAIVYSVDFNAYYIEH
ncbi:MAG TPA: type 4a pilus biogenesis protein PilO [Patescibacteria group bacterium]|nr:type 4a pilus biogenesis protein PilO [Patescibacteria group bacterium]